MRPFGRGYATVRMDTPYDFVCYKSIFAVAREHILQRSRPFYERLRAFVDKDSNPEAGH